MSAPLVYFGVTSFEHMCGPSGLPGIHKVFWSPIIAVELLLLGLILMKVISRISFQNIGERGTLSGSITRDAIVCLVVQVYSFRTTKESVLIGFEPECLGCTH